MEQVKICDITMREQGLALTFREKLELCKLLDKLGVSVIELNAIHQPKIDSLLIKSIASALTDACLCVGVQLTVESVTETWRSLQFCKKPRLQVNAPVSPVQMEYLYHKKPEAMLRAISETIDACCACGCDVEFVAEDATRSDLSFLYNVIQTAIEHGAHIVTLCDDAGLKLPQEIADLCDHVLENVPSAKDITLGIRCADSLFMANACCVEAVRHGIREIKAASHPVHALPLGSIARLLSARGSDFQVECSIRHTSLKRILCQIDRLCEASKNKTSPFEDGVRGADESVVLSIHEPVEAVSQAVIRLGYDLAEDDLQKVYSAFLQAAQRKEVITLRELDAIVAAEAMQVPPAWQVESYVINTGNNITAMAHMKLKLHDQIMEGISLGDGSIDAAFLAIEQTTGRHFELDDFQIQAVTQGREAMGETIVKLRHNGKVYAGRGISTDIVGAGIMAYLNALNKIVYEEEEA